MVLDVNNLIGQNPIAPLAGLLKLAIPRILPASFFLAGVYVGLRLIWQFFLVMNKQSVFYGHSFAAFNRILVPLIS